MDTAEANGDMSGHVVAVAAVGVSAVAVAAAAAGQVVVVASDGGRAGGQNEPVIMWAPSQACLASLVNKDFFNRGPCQEGAETGLPPLVRPAVLAAM